ncbi:cysteine--1-D-myo-inosityl 2-amino-2-deoxy-alpha-D-glucopyranoside ligase, partial [Rhodococcus hoagii]|nr:cysteine--1-D-myo-inosityl 2-amino-2-deoxy-alpha-D-glucopyranoside ligase [Prescottella equi]
GTDRFARHYVHTGMIGLDGEKMSKSRGNLVFVSKLRGEGVDPAAIRLGLLSGHYRVDRPWTDHVLADAQERLALWRKAAALESAPSAEDTVARLRQHLADDLDTPKALDALDGWARRAVDHGGPDAGAPGAFAAAVDALLGVELR